MAKRSAENARCYTASLCRVERILEKQTGTDRVLIVVDQFEELYTLTSDEEVRRRFLNELLAASSRTAKANVALTLRGDFVGRALAYRRLSDRLQDAQINLGPMTREELESAIRKPAEKIQLEFEPNLVRRILNDVGEEPGNLPLLEFVLKELWDKRRGHVLLSETYDAIGGLQGAVATKADELLKGLSSAEQTILQRVFLRIVRPARDGLDTRRRAAFTELPPEAIDLVTKLTNERLLVTNQSETGLERTVEVAHEALISNWSTLRAWVNEDREFLLWRDRLGTLLTEWERAQESDDALLRGPLLIEAQKWFLQRSQDLSDEERKFISSSRALRERHAQEEKDRQEREIGAARKLAEEQKQRAELSEQREKEQKEAASKLRRRAVGMAMIACVAVAASILLVIAAVMWRKSESASAEATRQANIANEQLLAAQDAVTHRFLSTIGVSNEEPLSEDEREALWEVAKLDRVNAAVRGNLLKGWFRTSEAFTRGEARGGQGFRAVTGLNLGYHRLALSGAAGLGERLLADLQNPQEKNFYRLSSIGRVLAAVVAEMEPHAAAEIARQGAQRLEAALENQRETNSSHLSSLAMLWRHWRLKWNRKLPRRLQDEMPSVLRRPWKTRRKRTPTFWALPVFWRHWRLKWNRTRQRRSQKGLRRLWRTQGKRIPAVFRALAVLWRNWRQEWNRKLPRRSQDKVPSA
jgi:hypothetical protein